MEFQIPLHELSLFARTFWKHVGDAKVFAFHGAMGAGKTTLIAALCREKGVHDAVASPTFSIINEYETEDGALPQKIFHMDLYRLKDEEEVVQAGVEDCVYSGALCFVEWPEKAPYLFDGAVHVFLEADGENERRVRIELPEAPAPISKNNRNL